MHVADINAALKKNGIGNAQLSEQCGVSASAVGKVIRGESRSAKIEKAISDKLGLPLHVLWPQYYSAPDQPEPARKEAAPNPLEALLIEQFRKLDLARQARLLQMAVELAGGAGDSHDGVHIGLNKGQVNKGGSNTFNKF